MAATEDANLAAQGIAVEIDFAIEEIAGVFTVLDESGPRCAPSGAPPAPPRRRARSQPFRDFAFDLEGYLEEARDFVAVLVERTTPKASCRPARHAAARALARRRARPRRPASPYPPSSPPSNTVSMVVAPAGARW